MAKGRFVWLGAMGIRPAEYVGCGPEKPEQTDSEKRGEVKECWRHTGTLLHTHARAHSHQAWQGSATHV